MKETGKNDVNNNVLRNITSPKKKEKKKAE